MANDGMKMTPQPLPNHPIFEFKSLGTSDWWQQLNRYGTPLLTVQDQQVNCIFIWQKKQANAQVWIDVYCQSAQKSSPWQAMQCIAGTDIAFYQVSLSAETTTSYVMLETTVTYPAHAAPMQQRAWWRQQLVNAGIDPHNPEPSYQSSLLHWINQVHLPLRLLQQTHDASTPSPQHSDIKQNDIEKLYVEQNMTWQSQALQRDYPLTVYLPLEKTRIAQWIVLLDGQIWHQHALGLNATFNEYFQILASQNSNCTTAILLLHSSVERRVIDYGCHYAFSHALAHDLVIDVQQQLQIQQATLQQNAQIDFASDHQLLLAGQSLSGLCALYSQLHFPEKIHSVIAQSPSLWWHDFQHSQPKPAAPSCSTLPRSKSIQHFNDYWFEHCAQPQASDCSTKISTGARKILLSAGRYETDMLQDSIQFNQLFQQFAAKQIEVTAPRDELDFQTFCGGHDPVSWGQHLSTLLLQHAVATH